MAKKLKDLKLDRIDLVDKGANQGSKVLIAKRDMGAGACPDCGSKGYKSDDCPTCQAHQKKESDMPDMEKRDAEVAELQKRLDTEKAEREKLAKQAAEDRAALVKMQDERERDQYIAKARGLKAFGPADDLGGDLRDIAKALGAERFTKLETKLRAIQKQLETSKLFAEMGAEGTSQVLDPYTKIEKAARELVSKGTDMTFEKAFDKVLQTPQGKEWYNEYLTQREGRHPGVAEE